MKENKIIAVDFDGTCVRFNFPWVGEDIGAAPVLRDLVAQGHKIILWTVRCRAVLNIVGSPLNVTDPTDFLQPAIDWFDKNEINLYGINENPQQKGWSSSPKAHADIFIDDMAMGCPLTKKKSSDRPYVNWVAVRSMLVEQEYLP